jgi:STE24 endopeptidase
MNVFTIIILIVLALNLVLELAASLLNLRSLRLALPASLEGIYNPADYEKSQRYTRESTHFGLIHHLFTLAVVLSFWFAGGFNFFDQMVRSWDLFSVLSGLVYIGILLSGYELLSLPFNLYDTFVIEQRFGFNKTTPRTFILDLVKEFFLALVLGGLILSAVLALFEYTGSLAWLYGWIAISLFSLLLQYAAPNWIMPLFNRFKPLEPGDLREAILSYTSSVKFPVANILVMDGSRRSSKSNAFFTGFGRQKRIALFDTLIKKHTVPELVAVLAHEVGHNKKRHILQGMIISVLHTGLLLFLLSLFIRSPGLHQAFFMEQQSVYAGLLFFGLLYTPIQMVLSILIQMFSRKNEYAADRYAAETINEPQDLVSALKKLASDNLSNLTPHPFYVFLNYSHPPLLERIRAIQNIRK